MKVIEDTAVELSIPSEVASVVLEKISRAEKLHEAGNNTALVVYWGQKVFDNTFQKDTYILPWHSLFWWSCLTCECVKNRANLLNLRIFTNNKTRE